MQDELDKLLSEGHITNLDKCTSDCFIAPIVITAKKDDSVKLELDEKPINRQLNRNRYQMPNVDELIDGVSQIVTAKTLGTLYFTVLDLNYAYSQLRLSAETAKQCNFNIREGQATGTYRFLTGFYGLADMPAEFSKGDGSYILNQAKNTFCFLDDILIVSKGDKVEHEKLVLDVLKKLDHEHPKTLNYLKSFLGSINHLSKFIPNAASLTDQLRPLLKEKNEKKKLKNIKLSVKKFKWGE